MKLTDSAKSYGNRQHEHMLGAGVAWFKGTFPEQWDGLKSAPAEQAINQMLAQMAEGS